MKDLRHIKLFEAFESSKLNKTLAFLNKDGKSKFLAKLKQVCGTIDLPESKLSDDLFEYLPYASAIKYNGDASTKIDCTEGCDKGKVTKKWGKGTRIVDCAKCKGTGKVDRKSKLSLIKFWFNKDGEFLSVTGVDGIYRPGNIPAEGQTRVFSPRLTDYNVGERVPKTRMADLLTTGDIVKLTLIERGWNNRDIPNVVAFILKHNNRCWAIQDQYSYSYNYLGIPYGNIGTRAWEMSNGSIRDIYKLNVKGGNVRTKDPMGYNSDMDDSFRMKSIGIRDNIKNANFALVLDINKLGTKDFGIKKDVIKNTRKEQKKDALAFMLDEDIKATNLKRYFAELTKRTKLVGSLDDMTTFSKMIVRLLGGKYSAYNLSYNSGDNLSSRVPSSIASNIFQMMKGIKKNQRDGLLDEYLQSVSFKNLVDDANSSYESGLDSMMSKNKHYSSMLLELKSRIKKTADADERQKETKIVALIDELSLQINKYILSMPCECLEDIEIILQEVENFRRIMSSERSGINSLNHYFGSMSPNTYGYGRDLYSSLRRGDTKYGNSINGLNHIISIIKRKQETYNK